MRVDLSKFFDDERKVSLVFIDESWNTIQDLADHIERLFNLHKVSLLADDECYLAPQESIKVLHFTQWIKAFTLTSGEVEHRSKCHRKKKRTTYSDESGLANSSFNDPDPKRSKTKEHNVSQDSMDTTATPNVNNSTQNGKTMLRHSMSVAETEKDKVNKDRDSQLADNVQKWSTSSSKSTKKDNHIFFEDGYEEQGRASALVTDSLNKNTSQKIVFRYPLMELDPKKPRLFKLPCSPSQKVRILENIIIAPPQPLRLTAANSEEGDQFMEETAGYEIAHLTLDEQTESESAPALAKTENDCAEETQSLNDSDIMVLDDTVNNENNVDDDKMELGMESENKYMAFAGKPENLIKNWLSNSIPLGTLPKKGDQLLFKLLKVRNGSQHGYTDYIAGKCSSMHRRSKAVTITITLPSIKYRNTLSQYCLHVDDSDQNETVLNLKFDELIEPRIIKSTRY